MSDPLPICSVLFNYMWQLKLKIFSTYILSVNLCSCFNEQLDQIIITFSSSKMYGTVSNCSFTSFQLLLKLVIRMVVWWMICMDKARSYSRRSHLSRTEKQLSGHWNISNLNCTQKWNVSFLNLNTVLSDLSSKGKKSILPCQKPASSFYPVLCQWL